MSCADVSTGEGGSGKWAPKGARRRGAGTQLRRLATVLLADHGSAADSCDTDTPLGVQQVKAMQYYRLWIYACNLVLLVAVLFFVAVGSYVFSDARMTLITSIRYYHPTFLYAYVAIVLQGGVVQVVGCVGALRLNERLLNTYWLMLLSLLIGDVVFGVVWVFRFQWMVTALPGELSVRLREEYSVDPEFTGVWDYVQTSERCCGLRSPDDFAISAWAIRVKQVQSEDEPLLLPGSCCRGTIVPVERFRSSVFVKSSHGHLSNPDRTAPVTEAFRKRKWGRKGIYIQRSHAPLHPPTTTEPPPYNGSCIGNDQPHTPFGRGCLQRLLHWYKNRADLLFIIGYCVITFLKVCFIGLLRCEIREMIQKMRMLRAEMAANGVTLGLSQTANDSRGDGAMNESRGSGGGLLAKVSASTVPENRRLRRQLMDEGVISTGSDTNSQSRLLDRSLVDARPSMLNSTRSPPLSHTAATSGANRFGEPSRASTTEHHELYEITSSSCQQPPSYSSQHTEI